MGDAGKTIRRSEEIRSESSAKKMRYPEPTFAKKPQWNNAETKEWKQDVNWKWERGNYTNCNYSGEERKEAETARSDRRSRNIKEHLMEAEKIRVAGIKKHEEREETERKLREKYRYAPPEQTTGREIKRSRIRTQNVENAQKETSIRTKPTTRAK